MAAGRLFAGEAEVARLVEREIKAEREAAGRADRASRAARVRGELARGAARSEREERRKKAAEVESAMLGRCPTVRVQYGNKTVVVRLAGNHDGPRAREAVRLAMARAEAIFLEDRSKALDALAPVVASGGAWAGDLADILRHTVRAGLTTIE